MTPDQQNELRRRQRGNARMTAILLGTFVVLVFAITIAKMLVNR